MQPDELTAQGVADLNERIEDVIEWRDNCLGLSEAEVLIMSSLHIACGVWLLMGCACASAMAQAGVAPERLLPRRFAGGHSVRAEWTAERGSRLRLRNGADRQVLDLAGVRVTTATVVATDAWLIGGVDAMDLGTARLLVRIDGEWVPASTIATGVAFPVSLTYAHGLVAALMSDGRLIAASCTDVTELPLWAEFDTVGAAPNGLRLGQLTSVHVRSSDRIELQLAMGGLHAWVRASDGSWTQAGEPAALRPRIVVERPVRIGSSMRVGLSLVEGPLVCEYGASGVMVQIEPVAAADSYVVLPDAWTASLQADQRYRLRSLNAVSAWFYPALVTGQAWGSGGVELQECRVYEAGACMGTIGWCRIEGRSSRRCAWLERRCVR